MRSGKIEPIMASSSDDAEVHAIEPNAHSFIVKIWLEETEEETGAARWRGSITHVPGGERSYMTDLSQIPRFVGPYLERMGVNLGFRWKVRQWLHLQ